MIPPNFPTMQTAFAVWMSALSKDFGMIPPRFPEAADSDILDTLDRGVPMHSVKREVNGSSESALSIDRYPHAKHQSDSDAHDASSLYFPLCNPLDPQETLDPPPPIASHTLASHEYSRNKAPLPPPSPLDETPSLRCSLAYLLTCMLTCKGLW